MERDVYTGLSVAESTCLQRAMISVADAEQVGYRTLLTFLKYNADVTTGQKAGDVLLAKFSADYERQAVTASIPAPEKKMPEKKLYEDFNRHKQVLWDGFQQRQTLLAALYDYNFANLKNRLLVRRDALRVIAATVAPFVEPEPATLQDTIQKPKQQKNER